MDYQFRAGMMRASDMCDAAAKVARAQARCKTNDVHARASSMDAALALTAMSFEILKECEIATVSEPAKVES